MPEKQGGSASPETKMSNSEETYQGVSGLTAGTASGGGKLNRTSLKSPKGVVGEKGAYTKNGRNQQVTSLWNAVVSVGIVR